MLREAPQVTEQVGEARQVRVTVVNNDTDFLSLMKEVLADRGWETTVIRESGSAYRLIKEHQPDVLLLDIRMETPESGWNVLELLKLDPETRDIPVVVCSAAALDVRRRRSGCMTGALTSWSSRSRLTISIWPSRRRCSTARASM